MIAFLLAAGLSAFGSVLYAQSRMTDSQVLEYVKAGIADGKSQDEMLKELAVKGVDRAQAQRVKAMYERENNPVGGFEVTNEKKNKSITHTVNGKVVTAPENDGDNIDFDVDKKNPEAPANAVFGHSIFRNKNLNFAPGENIPTPRNYSLGPGDEVIIEIFGANQTTFRNFISPEGSINVDILGPIYLNGMTIEEANKYLKKRLSSIYGGLNRDGDKTEIRLSLGQIRSIQINILGDVKTPGTYQVSSFTTVFHALYLAGGVDEGGTIRDIKVVRAGKLVGTVDVYDFLLNGSREKDMRLDEGDVILVKPYVEMVKISGNVKRPSRFEMLKGETLADLMKYAGGFTQSAYKESVTVTRLNGKAFEIKTVDKENFESFVLEDGDEVSVTEVQSLFENRLTIAGAVYIPGTYELNAALHTVKQLVEKAGGLLPDAFLNRAVIHREHPDKTMETFSVNLGKVMDGSAPDFELANNDTVVIASEYDLKDRGTYSISGYVKEPGTFPFAKNTTVEDLIMLAGGLRDGASLSRVDVNRRNKDESGQVRTNEIAKTFSFPIKNGFISDGNDFYLEAYDEVIVHKSPSYSEQQHYSVEGEVNFPGSFTMVSRTQRVSDLVKNAGGLTEYAYPKGARVFRKMNDDERRLWVDKVRAFEAMQDSTIIFALRNNTIYPVAINLEEAIANPGGDNDLLLRDGDSLVIPVINNTIRVSGSVMLPNTIAYNGKMRAKDYISSCGGYTRMAAKNEAFIIRVNGIAEPYRPYTLLEPGAEIVVPKKKEISDSVKTARLGMLANSASSVGMMLAYLLVAITRL